MSGLLMLMELVLGFVPSGLANDPAHGRMSPGQATCVAAIRRRGLPARPLTPRSEEQPTTRLFLSDSNAAFICNEPRVQSRVGAYIDCLLNRGDDVDPGVYDPDATNPSHGTPLEFVLGLDCANPTVGDSGVAGSGRMPPHPPRSSRAKGSSPAR